MGPNIVFLMTDQQRWDALGCVDDVVQTPNLDALARRGVRFSDACCNAPMCVPSRYSMLTGLYPSQCGVRHNTQQCTRDDDLPVPALPQLLADLGYQTAGFGKAHWYPLPPPVEGARPTSTRGFEVRAQARPASPRIMEPGAINMELHAPDAHARYQAEREPYGFGGENIAGYLGRTSALPSSEHREGWLTDRALEFLDRGRNTDRPLFLYLSFDFPHAGLSIPAGYEDRYDLADIPEREVPPWREHPEGHVGPDPRAGQWAARSPEERRRSTLRYYAACSYVDDLFGQVLRKLEELGELDDTLVLFTSDHGEMLGDRGHRFSKYCMYEGSVRVPLIVAGGAVPDDRRGTVDDRPAELVDVLPTLVRAAGGGARPELPGRDLLGPPGRRGCFAEMHGRGYEDVQPAPIYMWRTGRWKLICYLPGELPDAVARVDEVRGELYDLVADPGEWHNRYDDPKCRAVREELTLELLMHLACVWAGYPRQDARPSVGPAVLDLADAEEAR